MSLYLLDGPRTRWALKPSVWGPLALAGSAWCRHSGVGGRGDSGAGLGLGACWSLLEALARVLPDGAAASPFARDLVALLVARELLDLGVGAVREAVAWYGCLGMPAAGAWGRLSKSVQRALLTGAMEVAVRVPGLRGLVEKELGKECAKTEQEFMEKLRPEGRDALVMMPRKGIPHDKILSMMTATAAVEDRKVMNAHTLAKSAPRPRPLSPPKPKLEPL